MSFLGIDLHGNQFTVAKMVLKDEKVVIRTSTIRFGTEAYRQFLASLSKEDYLLVESSTNAFWFHCLLVSCQPMFLESLKTRQESLHFFA